MIRVTIELVPHGIGTPRSKGELRIANDGTGTDRIGNYNVKLVGGNGRVLTEARVEGFARKSRAAWELTLEALRAIERRRRARDRWMRG